MVGCEVDLISSLRRLAQLLDEFAPFRLELWSKLVVYIHPKILLREVAHVTL